MFNLFIDYIWKEGRPCGIKMTESTQGKRYKIITDPYYKQITIEMYFDGEFQKTIYDSRLLDFRLLRTELPQSWEKIEQSEQHQSLIRNSDHQITWIEKYQFEKNLCRHCSVFSPHGIALCSHKIYYIELNDTFNGIELFDTEDRIVMQKKYKLFYDGSFGELIHEDWNIK